jgi:heat shock protein HtpX
MLTQLFDVLFAILGSIVVNYFSRQREFRADAGSAKVTSREKMVAALRKLQLVYEGPRVDGEDEENKGLNAFKISNRSSSGFLKLFSTHPPLEERIQRLMGASRVL